MPFIRTSTNVSISDEKLNNLKSRYGAIIPVMGKSEDWLMLEFSDNNKMFFKGSSEPLAFVDVKTFRSPSNSNQMTGEITKVISDELGISSSRIYVSYQGINDWGFNGNNF